MQNRNYFNAEHNDTSITVHLQDSFYLVLFLTNHFLRVFGAKWLIEIKIVYSMVKYCCVFLMVWQIQTEIDMYQSIITFVSFCVSGEANLIRSAFFLSVWVAWIQRIIYQSHCGPQKYCKALEFWFQIRMLYFVIWLRANTVLETYYLNDNTNQHYVVIKRHRCTWNWSIRDHFNIS